MGGSLAAALSAAGWRVLLHHRRRAVAVDAERRGWGSAIGDLAEAAGVAELAVIATPVDTIADIARAIHATAPELLITDLGSSKAVLMRDLDDLSRSGHFVGSHPMCGSHRQGLAHADPELYRDALCVLTPQPAAPPQAAQRVEQLWRAAGCRTLCMDPAAHDRAVARASHVPHVLACAAASGLDEQSLPLAASGFRDTTRVAAAPAALWRAILLENRDAVLTALGEVCGHLDLLRQALDHGDAAAVEAWLQEGRTGRERFEQR